MEKRFIQREETRYSGNEFANMPSVDYGTLRSERLNRKRKSRIDLNLAKEICAKYGFKCDYIDSTFGGDDADFVVYYKTNINPDEFDALRKIYYKDENAKKKYWELAGNGKYNDIYRKLHECMHELDEQTALMFECGWHGNCGIFGSHDVSRMSYSGGDNVYPWHSIVEDIWASCIHNTRSVLSKGVYILAHTYYIKPEIQDSPKMEEMEQTILNLVRENLSDEFVANFETGRRQCDGKESYKALVVRYKDGDYSCMIRLSRDWMGRYKMLSAAPLCGESNWVIDWRNPLEDVRCALGSRRLK